MDLLIDDIRDIGCVETARTPEAAREALSRGGWNCVYLDHDLGEDCESGYDILKWALAEGLMPGNVVLVTANPVGRENMANQLLDHGYSRSYFNEFKKEVA